jgi:hypothetical protein
MEDVLSLMSQVTKAPDSLMRHVESLRKDMEQSTTGVRSFGINTHNKATPQSNWRGGSSFAASGGGASSPPKSGGGNPTKSVRPENTHFTPSQPGIKYKSIFSSKDSVNTNTSIDKKIMTTVIGNRLNSFTVKTYNDTRDFVYQILDSGEKEFIKDFLEQVFIKATLEETFCPMFAKLISEISNTYPTMLDEVQRYHSEFIKVFDSIEEIETTPLVIKQRLYRLGYVQFLSELACRKTLNKQSIIDISTKLTDKIWEFTALPDKINSVKECIDCYTRLVKSLKEHSKSFFVTIIPELQTLSCEKINQLLENKAGDRPSLALKEKCILMNLRDLILNEE